jgi:hyaluronoglucosaminidase
MYDPGMFPALDANSDKRRNGGVPQEGNLELHLEKFKKSMNELVPDVQNNGIIVIDFESWRPILRQNFGELSQYKEVSYKIERNRHPFWSDSSIKSEVMTSFGNF